MMSRLLKATAMAATTAVGVATWDFSIRDRPENQDLIRQVQTAQESGAPVQVRYREWLEPPISLGTKYEALTVTPAARGQ